MQDEEDSSGSEASINFSDVHFLAKHMDLNRGKVRGSEVAKYLLNKNNRAKPILRTSRLHEL